jgi:hypothetical protein
VLPLLRPKRDCLLPLVRLLWLLLVLLLQLLLLLLGRLLLLVLLLQLLLLLLGLLLCLLLALKLLLLCWRPPRPGPLPPRRPAQPRRLREAWGRAASWAAC